MKLLRLLCLAAFLCLPAQFYAALNAEESARVESMLIALGKQDNLIFIRNGSQHSAREAESHLRLKLSKIAKRINTAEDFIDYGASKSSISGQPYIVRVNGKNDETANSFLRRLLKDIDGKAGK